MYTSKQYIAHGKYMCFYIILKIKNKIKEAK